MGSTIDLLETFASLSGTNSPKDRKMDGYDLSPALLSTGKSPREEFYYWNRARLHAVRSGPWKLHFYQNEPVNYGRYHKLDKPELYHLENDISEAYEVADAHPNVVEYLAQKALMHKKDTEDSLPDQVGARIPNFKYRR